MSAKCDVCGKETENPYTHNNWDGTTVFCPECWDQFLHPEKFSDVIKLDPMQVDTFNEELQAGIKMAEDKDKKDQLKAIIGIQKELHELNKTLKIIAGRLR